jgi:hypothetical protein
MGTLVLGGVRVVVTTAQPAPTAHFEWSLQF